MAALSQLSYGPQRFVSKSSGEFEVAGTADSQALVVPCRRDSKMNLRAIANRRKRNEVAPIKLTAIRSERIYLVGCVDPAHEPGASSASRVTANNEYITLERRPLALNAQKLVLDPENQVVAAAFDRGPVDLDPELDRGLGDRSLGNRALLVCRQFKQQPKRTDRLGRAVS